MIAFRKILKYPQFRKNLSHHVENGFANPFIPTKPRSLKDVLLWRLGYFDDESSLPTVPKEFTYPNPFIPHLDDAPTVTWIHHSSVMIDLHGIRYVTDPILSQRCSPIPGIGPKSHSPISFSLNELSDIDMILISHNHYDHLDLPTVKHLHRHFPKALWVIPLGLEKWFRKQHISSVIECDWWETLEIKNAEKETRLEITSVPAQHFSGRSPFEMNRNLWCGWVVKSFSTKKIEKTFYFAGDTGYNPYDFETIGKTFGPIDLSLIPIGAYTPRRFMHPVHINPKQAIQIHRDVLSKLSVAIHWGTFALSDEPLDQPPYDLYLSMIHHHLPFSAFRVLNFQQKINW